MSYDIELVDENGNVLLDDTPRRGGTYAVIPQYAEFNITFNYAKILYTLFPEKAGLWWLNGKVARETVNVLVDGILKLNTDRDENYWTATEGNVRVALLQLLDMALKNPHGIWKISG